MITIKREAKRLEQLQSYDANLHNAVPCTSILTSPQIPKGYFGSLIYFAGFSFHPLILLSIMILSGALFALISLQFLIEIFSPLAFIAGIRLPCSLLEQKSQKRADKFMEEYPAVLLAMASGMKSNMTPYQALNRATNILPQDSPLKREIKTMIERINIGEGSKSAIMDFAKNIKAPELSLFRSSLALINQYGGKFCPTLERLAKICREKNNMLSRAKAITANMRMTGNALLLLTPVCILILSSRQENYWNILLHHEWAHSIASLGIAIIFAGYKTLASFSNFKP